MRRLMRFFRKGLRMAKDADPGGQAQQQENEPVGPGTSISLGSTELDSDHPISPEHKEDRLGFRSVASTLASSLLTQTTSHGMVVSIEGVWGSGKSSLVNLLIDELKKNQERASETVRFEPWLVGDRDGMLVELMSDLASAVEAIQASGKGKALKVETEKLAEKLRGYASSLSRQAAPIAQLAGIFGLPGGEAAGKILGAASEATAAFNPAKPLPQVKAELTTGLRELGRRIVVIIDDLDRLEPLEAAEIMRLIRAVADFPNVIYVLCYDPKILAKSLEEALSVNDGIAFLEKIVQVSFKVPQPEAFDLRRWLLDECLAFYNPISSKQLSHDQMQRLQSVCDVEGGLLTTPRDVIRAMNAIKLYWPPISDKVDYPDLVWLQMVKLENKNLYSWIENYLVECAAISQGASINEAGKIEHAKELKKHVTESGVGSARTIWTITEYVPGIQAGENVDDKDRLFNLGNEAEISSFERDRRLGSPQHSRYYFAFAKPAGALEDADLHGFISSAVAGKDLDDLCIALIQDERPQGGTKFDLLIDRLNRLDEAMLPEAAIPPILKALANCMDKDVHKEGKGDWGVRWSWRSASRLFKKLIARLPDDEHSKVTKEIFSSGDAIGWLTSDLIRGEIFAHGQYGDQAKPKEEWVFSKQELSQAIELLVNRFKGEDRDNIIDTPEVLHLMYGWHQSGDEAGVKDWVHEQQATDAGFLKLLAACRGWMQSDRTYYPLRRRDMERFLNFDEALERLRRIAEDEGKTEEERALADELLKAADIGNDD